MAKTTETTPVTKKPSRAIARKKMVDTFTEIESQLSEKRESEMAPEKKIEEKLESEATAIADTFSTEGIAHEIGALKSEIGKMLIQLSDKLEEEVARYLQVRKAVQAKERELQEIYDIQKTASTLTALIEAQQQTRQQFEAEMAAAREALDEEMTARRAEWDDERLEREAEAKEWEQAEKKRRERESEEHRYKTERERQLAKEQFDYDKAKLERDFALKREEMERDLSQREKAVIGREEELAQVRARVEAFPAERDAAVTKAVQEATDRLALEAKNREELLKNTLQGEHNVLKSRIESFQQTVKEQSAQIAKLTAQLEKSYGQVQDIAVKAIEGAAPLKTFAGLQPLIADSPRRAGQAEG